MVTLASEVDYNKPIASNWGIEQEIVHNCYSCIWGPGQKDACGYPNWMDAWCKGSPCPWWHPPVEGRVNFFQLPTWESFWLRVEREWAEQEKKFLYYPDQACPDMGESGCTYPDCDNCEVVYDDEEAEDR